MMMTMMLIIIIIINTACLYRYCENRPKTLRPSAAEEPENYQLTEQSQFYLIVSICSFLEPSTLKMPAHTISVQQRRGGL